MPYIVAVANLKGGAGKSTIAVNLACELATAKHVTLVDADAQGTATYYCSAGELPITCEHMPLEGSKESEIDRWARRVLGMGSDYVVLDAPPHVGAVTKTIIGIADVVLVPCTPSKADLLATVPTVELIRAARTQRTDGGPRCLLIPSRVDSRTTSGREIEAALKVFKEPIGPVIHQRAAFVDAFSSGQSIAQYAPQGDAHFDIATLATKVRRMVSNGRT